MTTQPAGSLWLKEHFGLSHSISHKSYIGIRDKIEIGLNGLVEQTYGPKYAPADTITGHIEFMLKYDDFSLDLLSAIFSGIDEIYLLEYLSANPTGRYARKIGFLYEWLTGKTLNINYKPGGNYVDLLDENYITGTIKRNSRWRINDNLLGTQDFCPIIRRTKALEEMLSKDLIGEINGLKDEYSPEVFSRATQYLYRKETRSSYEIESEKPSPDRMNRFIAILHEAGKKPAEHVLEEKNLTALQNAIVDVRYAQQGYRNFQNYISQTNYRQEEIYHYICPPPNIVQSLMHGLAMTEQKTYGVSTVIRATIIAFGFVFIHPFLDGNGRIHRFLIHDMLTRDGLSEKGMIIPVSAHILNNLKEYNSTLEDYSAPLMKRIRFDSTPIGEVTVTNPEEVATYFKYPDLTVQSIYLANTIYATIRQDLTDELFFLERYDELKRELQNFIDMPDKRLNEIIVFLHQNKGIFPNRRKKHFEEIKEEEFSSMEKIYSDVFKND